MKPAIFIAGGAAVVAVIAVVVLAILPAQGTSLAQAAENMKDQNVRMEIELGITEDGETMSMDGTSVMNADGTRMRMDVTMTQDGESLDMTIVMIGHDTWYTAKDLEGELPDGKRWVHEVKRTGALPTMTMAEFADFLSRADEVENKGETTIDGKTVEHFQGKVNAHEVAEETGGETAKRVGELVGDRDVFIPIEAWIGKDGLPVRLAMQTVGGGESISSTAKIVEYGVAVSVEPPPAAETAEFDDVMGG